MTGLPMAAKIVRQVCERLQELCRVLRCTIYTSDRGLVIKLWWQGRLAMKMNDNVDAGKIFGLKSKEFWRFLDSGQMP